MVRLAIGPGQKRFLVIFFYAFSWFPVSESLQAITVRPEVFTQWYKQLPDGHLCCRQKKQTSISVRIVFEMLVAMPAPMIPYLGIIYILRRKLIMSATPTAKIVISDSGFNRAIPFSSRCGSLKNSFTIRTAETIGDIIPAYLISHRKSAIRSRMMNISAEPIMNEIRVRSMLEVPGKTISDTRYPGSRIVLKKKNRNNNRWAGRSGAVFSKIA